VVKVIFLLKFRRDLDPDEVRRWWRSEHGALALRNSRMRRYVQNHWQAPIAAEHAEGGLEFQGCVEVWFDSMEDYEATMASPEWRALEEDGPNGFEMAQIQGGFVTEHVMRWDALPDARVITTAGEVPAG
jgi:uncharacterized protein (TIGR02118 family)